MCPTFERQNKFKLLIGPEFGYSFSTLTYSSALSNNLKDRPINNSLSYIFGIKTSFSHPFGFSDKIAPSLGLLYMSHKYIFPAYETKYLEYSETEINTSIIKNLPMLIRHSILHYYIPNTYHHHRHIYFYNSFRFLRSNQQVNRGQYQLFSHLEPLVD